MKYALKKFVAWYDRHQNITTVITAALFLTQILHLYWLGVHVLSERLFGVTFFDPSPFWQNLIIVFDYFEIPALVSATILYGRRYQKTGSLGALRNLIFINLQYLHIFWITDEFVEAVVRGGPRVTILPPWLALIAIVIDYLEVPVIIETLRDAVRIVRKRLVQQRRT